MELFYKWAEKVVKKHQEEEEAIKLARKNQEEAWKLQKAFLQSFAKNYVSRAKEAFESQTKPEFAVGEIVYTNWYADHDSWEGHIQSLQKNCPFRGPIKVEILESFVDTNFIVEELNTMISRGSFDRVVAPYNPDLFDSIANKHVSRLKYPPISWAYKIKIPGDDKKYWPYSFREKNFMKIESSACQMSLELWKIDSRKEEIQAEMKKLHEDEIIKLELLKTELKRIKK